MILPKFPSMKVANVFWFAESLLAAAHSFPLAESLVRIFVCMKVFSVSDLIPCMHDKLDKRMRLGFGLRGCESVKVK